MLQQAQRFVPFLNVNNSLEYKLILYKPAYHITWPEGRQWFGIIYYL